MQIGIPVWRKLDSFHLPELPPRSMVKQETKTARINILSVSGLEGRISI